MISEPNLFRMIMSINARNKDSSKGAKIMNASWGSPDRPYTLRCRRYDTMLQHYFSDLTYIFAAGNDGKCDAICMAPTLLTT